MNVGRRNDWILPAFLLKWIVDDAFLWFII